MPTGLTWDELTFRAMLEYINDLTPQAQVQMRGLLSIMPTRLLAPTPESTTYRTTHGFQVHRSEGVVQMSDGDSDASWDGHEPEDL